jgi:group I intron endonuclease
MGIISGIYEIRNKLNRHKYIGSSVDIESRWEDHKRMLRGGCHYNIYLQRAWNKYGEENFEFKIVAYTDPDKAIVLEDFILQNYFDRFEYNIAKSAVAPFLGREHTEEEKRKMSELKLGENNPFYEKHHSKEAKHKMSKAQSGKNHPMYGKHLLEETKQKLSEC